MMKKMYLKLMTAAFAVLLLSACGADNSYLSALPGNSILVAKVNVGNLLNESEVLSDPQISEQLRDGINELSGDTKTLMRELLEDPSACGADLSRPMYIALENVENARGVIIIPISDAQKVEQTIETFISDRDLGIDMELSTKDDVNTIENSEGDVIAAFDDDKFVVAFTNGTPDAMVYMTLSEKKQEKSDELEEFIDLDADMAVYADYGELIKLAERAEPSMRDLDLSMYENAKFIASVDFEKGQAKSTYKMLGCDEVEKLYDEMYDDANNNLLGYMPKDTWAAAQFGIKDLAKVEEFFKGKMLDELEDGLEELNDKLAAEGINVKLGFDLLKSLDGDVAIGATPFVKKDGVENAQVVFIAECANKDLFEEVATIIKETNKDAKEIDDDLYSLGLNLKMDKDSYDYSTDEYKEIRKGYDYYFGYADGKMFVMPENLYEECSNGGQLQELKSNLKDNEMLFDLIDGKNSGAIDFTACASMLKTFGNSVDREAGRAMKSFESLSFNVKSAHECEVVLTMTDKDTEVLKLLKDFCVEMVIAANK